MEFDSIIRPRLITTKTGLTNRSSERNHCCPVIVEFEYRKLFKNRRLSRQNACRDFSSADLLIS
jgi:hypothetical protein